MQPHDYYPHVASLVYSSVWAILPEKLSDILGFIEVKRAGGVISHDEIDALVAGRRDAPGNVGNLAVIPIYGVISQRASLLNQASGGTSIDGIRGRFRQAMADPSVDAILFDVDSPGGTVNGVDELANEIYQSRKTKPTVAVANTLAASAAYWLATAASEFYASPSADVGSIGVFTAHDDVSKALDSKGIRTTLVSAGKYKTEGHPYGPLTDEAKAAMQERVNDHYGMFTRRVAQNRGVDVSAVRNGFGEGRVVGAAKAKTENMTDGTMTLDDAIAMMARRIRNGKQKMMMGEGWMTRDEAIASGGADEMAFDREGNPVWRSLGLGTGMDAGPIPYQKAPSIASDDAPWDASAEVGKANGASELRRMHVWVDSSADPDLKGSYKGPHHRANGQLVPKGLYALAARVDQMDIPSGDMAGVKAHIAGHYHEMGKRAPWESQDSGALELRRRRLAIS